MKVCVLGAGVTGIATAYYLARDGHDVVVVDRQPQAAMQASFANGGQLSYSYVAPLAESSVLKKLPTLLADRDSPLRFRLQADPHQWRWCMSFLAACRGGTSRNTTAQLLQLGFYSRDQVEDIVAHEPIDFDHARSGKLVVYRDGEAFAGARAQMALQAKLGCVQEAVGAAECAAIEPALDAEAPRLVGGIYTPSEASGDCHAFCVELGRLLQARDRVRFLFGTTVNALVTRARSVVAAETSAGTLEADLFVCCLGVAGRRLLALPGLRLPVYPLTGYSLTIAASAKAPRVSVTDAHRKVVYARLGSRLRVAGMVDMGRVGERDARERLDLLASQARAFMPEAGEGDAAWKQALRWTGQRPATPSGKPLVGATPYRGLWLNTGHGALGFTLACGSAALLADLVAARPTAIDPTPFRLR